MEKLCDVTMESPANSPTISQRSSVTNLSYTFVSNNTSGNDEAEMRKARMNSSIISAFKSTCPPGVKPYITGVGLYTHIQGPSKIPMSHHEETLLSRPIFLPSQRPLGSEHSGSKLPEKVRKAWEDLRDVVKAEEEVVGKLELGLEYLTQRYGGLTVPESAIPLARSEGEDTAMQWDRQIRHDRVIAEGAMELHSASRRMSDIAAASASKNDVTMQGTEEETNKRRPSGTKIYGPDPRRQR